MTHYILIDQDDHFLSEGEFSVPPPNPVGKGWRWVDSEDPAYSLHAERVLASAKASQLNYVNRECDRRMSLLVVDYPAYEVSTFSKQESEARAYLVDAESETPMLDALSAQRDIAKSELVTRILVKATTFAQYSGAVIGYRQKLEDEIVAAVDRTALDAINLLVGWPS